MANANSICACGNTIPPRTGRGRPRVRCHVCSPPKQVPKRQPQQRTCQHCEATFVGTAAARYCSSLCKGRAAYEKRHRIPCRICGLPTGWLADAKDAPESPKHDTCEPEHGTPGRYARGCRCTDCTLRVSNDHRGYMRLRRALAPTHLQCRAEGCERTRQNDGLCGMHHRRKQKAEGTWKPSPSDAWDNPRRIAGYKRRKALTRGHLTDGERFTVHELIARDGRDCGICGAAIPNVAYPDPQSPSIDHIVPLSRGGEHTLNNARATHLICNVRRGNRDTPSNTRSTT